MKQKKWMKGAAIAAIAAMSMGMLAGCGGADEQQYRVGIVQLVQHGALDLANQGMVDGLKDSGFEEGKNLTINQQNAQNDQSNLQNIAQQFISEDADVILAIATPAAQVMASATEEIPIVGTAITSFPDAGLVESNEAPGTNVTGTNDMTPVAEQIDLLLQVVPDAKTIGTIYTSSEKNSQIQIGILKEVAAERGLTIEDRSIQTVNDIQQAVQSLVGEVDALWLPTDNNVASAMSQVISITDEAGLVVLGGEESQVTAGATLTYGINFYQIGYNAGVMAAQILNGESTPAEMPVQSPSEFTLVINEDAVEILGIEIPDELMEKAELVKTEAK
ncbi:MAG: ABC transporter substrate-binding protein [Peptococcaceae bacterium]